MHHKIFNLILYLLAHGLTPANLNNSLYSVECKYNAIILYTKHLSEYRILYLETYFSLIISEFKIYAGPFVSVQTMSEFDRAGTMTMEALRDLGLSDSKRVYAIQQDLDSARARFVAVQQSSSNQQTTVNAAFAQMQDPAHNIALLLNWVLLYIF